MRDYCLHEAKSRMAYGRLTFVVRVFGNWRMRSDLHGLDKLSDFQPKDIGFSRADILFLANRPLGSDWTWELERRLVLSKR